jgi:hypothetical protein
MISLKKNTLLLEIVLKKLRVATRRNGSEQNKKYIGQ